jgi:hypothetical protein
MQYDDDKKYAILKRRKANGSSGSPAVTCDGKVLGMHFESFAESPECISSYTAGELDSPIHHQRQKWASSDSKDPFVTWVILSLSLIELHSFRFFHSLPCLEPPCPQVRDSVLGSPPTTSHPPAPAAPPVEGACEVR